LTCEECGHIRKVQARNLRVDAYRFSPLKERNEGPGISADALIAADFPHWTEDGDGSSLCPKCSHERRLA